MAWYYTRIIPLSGHFTGTVAPAGAPTPTDYEFFQSDQSIGLASLDGNSHPSIMGPYNSLPDAQAVAKQFPPQTLTQSMDSQRTNVPGVTGALNAASGIVSTGINATGAGINLINALTQASTWIRIAEVVLGLVLIAVGVAKLTNAVPIATKTAATAARIGKVFT